MHIPAVSYCSRVEQVQEALQLPSVPFNRVAGSQRSGSVHAFTVRSEYEPRSLPLNTNDGLILTSLLSQARRSFANSTSGHKLQVRAGKLVFLLFALTL